ncbi:OFA family MFS transporter [uncultured Lutibacter sp.]|uniref:L-lactate MFS transporter n=1 Tax=uncultured Lutibacter sp. TaxID=437739 RepID=UPI00261C6439|nr:OFA family MFS transporter [uncultured Lutibacter sp.]
MNTQHLKNRWLIAASAVGIQVSIGSVYAYSVMTNPVKDIFEVEGSAIKWAFKLAILMLGFSAAFLGKWVEKVGPKRSGTTAGILYGIGIVTTGIAIHIGSLPLFYIGYGVIGGIGLGLGYISPISTLVKWFPDKKGLATGMAIMGFGFSALIFGPFMQYLFNTVGVANAFYVLGSIFMVLIVGSARYMQQPPKEYIPEGYHPENNTLKQQDLENISAKEAIKKPRFYYLWLMMFINIACGIALISSASPILQEKLNYSPMEAAAMVGFIGIFNGLGRLFWSSLSDYLGRITIYILFFAFQIVAFYLLPALAYELLFLATLFTIISMYGGGFAMLPAFISDLFGTKELGAIQGLILTAWGLAGVVGPTIYDVVKEKTGSLDATLYVFASLFIVALIVAIVMKFSITKAHKNKTNSLKLATAS